MIRSRKMFAIRAAAALIVVGLVGLLPGGCDTVPVRVFVDDGPTETSMGLAIPIPANMYFNPDPAIGSARSVRLTVVANTPAVHGDLTVFLTYGMDTSVLTAQPSSLTIAAGQMSGQVDIPLAGQGNGGVVSVTASLNGSSMTRLLKVEP
jgi:hypothetical protein